MTAVARLLTFVDVDEDDDGPGAHTISVSASLEAVLADGRRVVLVGDRGWSSAVFRAVSCGEPARKEHLPDVWAYETAEEIERTARVVVGPRSRSTVGRKLIWKRATGTTWPKSSSGRASMSSLPT